MPNDKIGTLVNAFQGGLPHPWAISYANGGTYSLAANNLTINVPANTASSSMQVWTYQSGATVYWDLTESQVLVQVNAGAQSAAVELWCPQLMDSAGHWFGWHIVNGQLQVSYQGSIRASATYSTVTHAWLRIRETRGTTYYDYSADGLTWTNLYSVADSSDQFCLSAVYPNLYIGSNSSGTNAAGSAVFDNFNYPAVPVQQPTYALNGSNLPASTTSATIVNFTDVNGEVWVARNTANAGNGVWRRARDVLFAKLYRNAALNTVVSPGAVIAFDTAQNDNFGMYVGSTFFGVQVPIGGWYQVHGNLQIVVAAANQYIQGWLQQNTGVSNGTVVQWSSDNNFSARASGGLLWRTSALMYLTANDIVNLKAYSSTAYGISVGNSTVSAMEVNYMGSG